MSSSFCSSKYIALYWQKSILIKTKVKALKSSEIFQFLNFQLSKLFCTFNYCLEEFSNTIYQEVLTRFLVKKIKVSVKNVTLVNSVFSELHENEFLMKEVASSSLILWCPLLTFINLDFILFNFRCIF